LKTQTLVYVGDNPVKDFLASNDLGWSTVHGPRSASRATARTPVKRTRRSRRG